MGFTELKNNIEDIIKEEQIKLGYRDENIRLYYPLASLNRFIEETLDAQEMYQKLQAYFSKENLFVETEISFKGDRFCINIPRSVVNFVHEHTKNTEFIQSFIQAIGKHECSIEELHAIFCNYSTHVHFEKVNHGEFDYLIYFEDGTPDTYRYCITDEGCHMIYHRFTPADYEDFCFEE